MSLDQDIEAFTTSALPFLISKDQAYNPLTSFIIPPETMISTPIPSITSTTATTTTTSPVDFALQEQSQHPYDRTESMDSLSAAMPWGHFEINPSQTFNPHQQVSCSPEVSSVSPSPCSPSMSGESVGRFSGFQPCLQSDPHIQGDKVIDSLAMFAPHGLEMGFVSQATSFSDMSTPCSPPAIHPSPVYGGAAFSNLATYSTPLPMNAGTTLDSAVNSKPKTASDSPTSSCSGSPPSSAASSPTSPSYEDIVLPAAAPSYEDIALPVVACGNCKRSHIKCDHGRPCQNCQKHPIKVGTCQDAVPKPRGRPKGGSKAAAESMASGRVSHLGFHHFYQGGPYQMRGQPEQMHRQRAVSWSHILPSQHLQQAAFSPSMSSHQQHSYHPYQQQLHHPHRQRSESQPLLRIPSSNGQVMSPGTPPFPWSDAPELKSMPLVQGLPPSSPMFDMQASPSHQPSCLIGTTGPQATQASTMFASPMSGSPPPLSAYQFQSLQQQHPQQHQQLMFQRNRSQTIPHSSQQLQQQQQHPFH
ncbi:hypothetical protein B0O80DRAFT_494725 [Mortierella sp. GBAus27b]|nr:hypothetical protein B0O80DRAFT_494725 [Mortierella sp. GBAus27b]